MLFLGIICDPEGISCADPTKLRFENNSNKKTLKQAWRFLLLNYLFVTQTYESSNLLDDFDSFTNQKHYQSEQSFLVVDLLYKHH